MNEEAEQVNKKLHKEFDELLNDREPKFNIGPKHLRFMEEYKPTRKNPKNLNKGTK